MHDFPRTSRTAAKRVDRVSTRFECGPFTASVGHDGTLRIAKFHVGDPEAPGYEIVWVIQPHVVRRQVEELRSLLALLEDEGAVPREPADDDPRRLSRRFWGGPTP